MSSIAKKILLAFLISGLTVGICLAEELKHSTISGGGAKTDQIHDLIQQPVIGISRSGDTTVYIGGIYGMLEARAPLGAIQGFVYDETNAPKNGAIITIEQLGKSATSGIGANGEYRFDNVAVGTYTLRCEAAGYKTEIKPDVVVREGEITGSPDTDFRLTPDVQTGKIRDTQIFRTADTIGSNIKITWDYDPAFALKEADIWMLAGAGQEFSRSVMWVKIAENRSGREYIEGNFVVGDGNNAYYRVVSAGSVPGAVGELSNDPTIFDDAENNVTVGKVDIALKAKYNSVCLPLVPNASDVTTVIGDQLTNGDQIHPWIYTAQNYVILTKTSAGWPAHNLLLSESFLVYLKTKAADKLTLVGRVQTEPYPRTLDLKYNAVGLPFPQSKAIGDAGFTPTKSDQIHYWNYDAQNYEILTYLGANWNNKPGEEYKVDFKLGEGKLYYIPPGTSNTQDWEPQM